MDEIELWLGAIVNRYVDGLHGKVKGKEKVST